MCSGFPPPQTALVTVASGENGTLGSIWCNSGEVRVKEQGSEIRIDRIQICVMIINVWCWASILSLWSGDGFPLLMDLYEVCQWWQNLYNTNY